MKNKDDMMKPSQLHALAIALLILLSSYAIDGFAQTDNTDSYVYLPFITTKPPEPINLFSNPSFEQGWSDLPPAPGNLINQRPNEWSIQFVPIGDEMWGLGTSNGIPEAIHKLTDQLPPNEQIDGADALILDGEHVYKVFHFTASFGASLCQTVTVVPDVEYTVTAPINVHADGHDKYSVGVRIRHDNNNEDEVDDWHWNDVTLPNRQWAELQHEFVAESDNTTICIDMVSRYRGGDVFIDAVELMVQ